MTNCKIQFVQIPPKTLLWSELNSAFVYRPNHIPNFLTHDTVLIFTLLDCRKYMGEEEFNSAFVELEYAELEGVWFPVLRETEERSCWSASISTNEYGDIEWDFHHYLKDEDNRTMYEWSRDPRSYLTTLDFYNLREVL